MKDTYDGDTVEVKAVDKEEMEDILEVLPENRVVTYNECSRLYERALMPHIDQAKIWGRIDKLFTGVPPFNPCLLKELGQTHVVNTDFGDSRSKLQKAISSYYNIFYKNKFLADIKVQFTPELFMRLKEADDTVGEIDSRTADLWSSIVTEEWTKSKRDDWKNKFLDFISAHLRQTVLYGVNHIFFPDRENPIPESGSIYAHYSPMDAYVDPDRNDVHIVKHTFTLFELLRFYTTDKTNYWNKEALGELIMAELADLDEGDDSDDTDDQVNYIEQIVERMRRHEWVEDDFQNHTVEVASLYIKEFKVAGKSEGVSHVIYTPHVMLSAPIFFHDRAYDHMREVIIISTLLPGFEEVHDCKGLGHIGFGHLMELNKLKCNFATNLKLSGTTFFKTNTSSISDLRKITVPVSGLSMLPENISLEHANTNLAAQNILAGVQYLENDLDKNSLFVLNPASSDTAPVGTMQQRAKEAAELQQNNLAHYMLTTLDKLYTGIFKKELQYRHKKNQGAVFAARFIQRCILRGVPQAVFEYKKADLDEVTGLPTWFSVTSYKGTGSGSQVGDSLKISEAYQYGIPQKLKSRGAQYFRELEVASIFGQEAVSSFYPAEDIGDEPTMQAVIASLVVNDLEVGKKVQFSPDVDHAVFATILLEKMQEVLEAYLQQPPTQQEEYKEQERELIFQTDIALQSIGSYLAMHMTYLAEDPAQKPLYLNMLPMFNRLEGMSQGIHANAQKARDAQARDIAEEQAGNNAQMRKVIFEHERGKMESQLKHAREMFDLKGSFNLNIMKAQNQANIDRIKAVGDAQAKVVKAQVEKDVDKPGGAR